MPTPSSTPAQVATPSAVPLEVGATVPTAAARWSRGGRVSLVLMFVVAALLRLASAVATSDDPLRGDEIEYDALARGLVETGSYTRQPDFSPLLYSPAVGAPTMFRPPGWPAVLAASYAAFGTSTTLPARVGLALWNAAGCLFLVALVLAALGDRRVAMAAGWVWAFWPASLLYPGTRCTTLISEGLATPLLILAMLSLAHVPRRGRGLALAAGVLFGLCALVRSNLVLCLPLGALWLLAATRSSPRAALRAVSLFLVASGLVVLPWMIRNHRTMGSFSIASQREVFFLGNNAWARGSYDSEFFSDTQSAQVAWLIARHPDLHEQSELEKAQVYLTEAKAYARQHPGRQGWLLARKALMFGSPLRETDDGDNGYDWAYATVASLCVLGAGSLLPTNRVGVSLLLLPVITTAATCVLTLFMPRYRYPAEPFLVALACQALALGVQRHGSRMLGLAGLVLAANLVAALLLR